MPHATHCTVNRGSAGTFIAVILLLLLAQQRQLVLPTLRHPVQPRRPQVDAAERPAPAPPPRPVVVSRWRRGRTLHNATPAGNASLSRRRRASSCRRASAHTDATLNGSSSSVIRLGGGVGREEIGQALSQSDGIDDGAFVSPRQRQSLRQRFDVGSRRSASRGGRGRPRPRAPAAPLALVAAPACSPRRIAGKGESTPGCRAPGSAPAVPPASPRRRWRRSLLAAARR